MKKRWRRRKTRRRAFIYLFSFLFPGSLRGNTLTGLSTRVLTHQQNNFLFGFGVVCGSSRFDLLVLQWNWERKSRQICSVPRTCCSLSSITVRVHQIRPNSSLCISVCLVLRLLEHHSVWAKALLQALHQALQRGRALGLWHPEDHRYQSTGGNADTAPHQRYWGESQIKQNHMVQMTESVSSCEKNESSIRKERSPHTFALARSDFLLCSPESLLQRKRMAKWPNNTFICQRGFLLGYNRHLVHEQRAQQRHHASQFSQVGVEKATGQKK